MQAWFFALNFREQGRRQAGTRDGRVHARGFCFLPIHWLGISVLSLKMAAASTWVLISHNDRNPTDGLYSVYDAVARFVHETIRLTFKTDRKPVAVFVAPVGILNPKATFNWVQGYLDFKPRFEELAAEPKAPVRLLDADWAPVFSDQSR